MEQGQVVAIRHLGLWQYGKFIKKDGWKYHFKVGREHVTVNYQDIEFPRYHDEED